MIGLQDRHLFPPRGSVKQISIHIGAFYATREPLVIATLLGSCVAVCLFDPQARIGGMNHILLPGRADMKKFDQQARYGLNAIELLVNQMMKLGAEKSRMQAKVFGGAHLLAAISEENGVGRAVSDFVLEVLRLENIAIVARDIGGYNARNISLDTGTGRVLVKKLSTNTNTNINTRTNASIGNLYRQEQDFLRHFEQKINQPGNLTIFE